MFELQVALRRNSALSARREWVGWAPLCPALAAENGLLLWTRESIAPADIATLRDCVLYEEEWEARRRAREAGSPEEVILEGARGRLVITRRRRRIGGWPGGRSRVEREMRKRIDRELRGDMPAVQAIGWVEERRRGRVVTEYAISRPLAGFAACEEAAAALSAATPTRSTCAA